VFFAAGRIVGENAGRHGRSILAGMKVLCMLALLLMGCGRPAPHHETQYQRFVLVPDPSQINKDIPAGALALDTKTGIVCYTVGGQYTSEYPSIEMCSEDLKDNP
jgi:hypothetical protein